MKENEEKLVQLNCRMPDTLRRGLRAIAALEGVPVQDLLVEIVAAYVDTGTGSGPADPRRKDAVAAVKAGVRRSRSPHSPGSEQLKSLAHEIVASDGCGVLPSGIPYAVSDLWMPPVAGANFSPSAGLLAAA